MERRAFFWQWFDTNLSKNKYSVPHQDTDLRTRSGCIGAGLGVGLSVATRPTPLAFSVGEKVYRSDQVQCRRLQNY